MSERIILWVLYGDVVARKHLSETRLVCVRILEIDVMLMHAVYLWLHDDLTEEKRREFHDALKVLTTAHSVIDGYVGVPADISRDIIDRSYSYSLVLIFKDMQAHNEFQTDPKHQHFRDRFRSYWRKVQIYDSVELHE